MKKHDNLALYLLADGTQARPEDCEADADGILRHIYGMPVALREDGAPMTIGQAAEENKNVEAAQIVEENAPDDQPERPADAIETLIDPATGQAATETAATDTPEPPPAPESEPTKEVKPAAPKRYKTREVKAR